MSKQKLILTGLALCSTLGFAGLNASPTSALEGSVIVGGEELYGSSTTYNTDSTASFDPSTNTLTLSDYSGGAVEINLSESAEDVSIKLVGENTITTSDKAGINSNKTIVFGDNISTAATLNVINSNTETSGLFSPNAGFYVTDASIDLSDSDYSFNFSCTGSAMQLAGDGYAAITIEGGTVKSRSNSAFAILGSSSGYLNIYGDAKVDVEAEYLNYPGNIVISGGELTFSTSTGHTSAINASRFTMNDGKVTINANGKGIDSSNINIHGGELTINSVNEALFANYSVSSTDSTLAITGGNVTLKNTSSDHSVINVDHKNILFSNEYGTDNDEGLAESNLFIQDGILYVANNDCTADLAHSATIAPNQSNKGEPKAIGCGADTDTDADTGTDATDAKKSSNISAPNTGGAPASDGSGAIAILIVSALVPLALAAYALRYARNRAKAKVRFEKH